MVVIFDLQTVLAIVLLQQLVHSLKFTVPTVVAFALQTTATPVILIKPLVVVLAHQI
jgi:hypothetical protein